MEDADLRLPVQQIDTSIADEAIGFLVHQIGGRRHGAGVVQQCLEPDLVAIFSVPASNAFGERNAGYQTFSRDGKQSDGKTGPAGSYVYKFMVGGRMPVRGAVLTK